MSSLVHYRLSHHARPKCAPSRPQLHSVCSIQWGVVAADSRSVGLDYTQLFAAGVQSVIVQVWLENHRLPTPLDAAHTMATLELRPDTAVSGVSRVYGDISGESTFNPLVDPIHDGFFDTTLTMSSGVYQADSATTVVEDASGDAFDLGGSVYSTQLTLRAQDDGVVRGAYNMTVRVGAYLYEASGARFPAEGFLPSEKYFVPSKLPPLLGGTSSGVSYDNLDRFNVTLGEVDSAGFTVECGSCATTELGDACELLVRLKAVPRFPVTFMAAVSLSGAGVYEARLSTEATGGGTDRNLTYTIEPADWKRGVVVYVIGEDDAIYERTAFPPSGLVPYNVSIAAFDSEDPAFVGITNEDGALSVTCAATNADDETGGFLLLQNGASPPGKIVTSADESGGFGVVEIELKMEPSANVYVPVFVDYGLVEISSPELIPCPSWALNESLGVTNVTLCLEFAPDDAGDWIMDHSIVYTGIDDGGAAGTVNAGGASSFRVSFGPSTSDDPELTNLQDFVLGDVIDNVSSRSIPRPNTPPPAHHVSPHLHRTCCASLRRRATPPSSRTSRRRARRNCRASRLTSVSSNCRSRTPSLLAQATNSSPRRTSTRS